MASALSLTKVGIVLLAPSAYLLYRLLCKRNVATSANKTTARIPLYGETPCLVEKYIYIRTEDVGFVIGRHGQNLRRIEHETRTYLTMVTDGPSRNIEEVRSDEAEWVKNDDDEEDVPLTMRYNQYVRVRAQTRHQIDLVERAIRASIRESTRRHTTVEMRIPAETVGYVIGKDGDRIKRLNAEFGVYTFVSQTGDEFEKVTMRGSPEGIAAAQTRLMVHVDQGMYLHSVNNNNNTNASGDFCTVQQEIEEMNELRKQLEDDEEW